MGDYALLTVRLTVQVVEKIFIEPDFVENSDPDPFTCSDADTMLTYLTEHKNAE